jgi:hypothetical protein
MNTYLAKLEVVVEIEAFNENDANEYINDIFGTDEEIKKVNIISIKEKKNVN